MMSEWEKSQEARIEALRAQVAERDAMIAEIIGDDNLENQYLFQIAELRGRVAKHKATIAERDATIAELRAQVSNRSVTLARYKHAYQAEKNMFADCETLRQAEMATVAELRAQVAAVPVDCIRRYHACTHYDAAANDVEYTTQQFDSDDMWIGIWLESLEDDA